MIIECVFEYEFEINEPPSTLISGISYSDSPCYGGCGGGCYGGCGVVVVVVAAVLLRCLGLSWGRRI